MKMRFMIYCLTCLRKSGIVQLGIKRVNDKNMTVFKAMIWKAQNQKIK